MQFFLNDTLIKRSSILLFLVVTSFGLSACGGGGGSSLPDVAPPDETAPVVLTVKPALNEIDVPVDTTKITLTFDESIKGENILPSNVFINEVDNNGVVIQKLTVDLISASPINYIDSTKKLIITTVANGYKENQQYQIRITNITDKFDNVLASYTSRFTTTKFPSIILVKPADDVTNSIPVSTAQKIIIEFDEVMDDASLKSGFTLTEKLANVVNVTRYKFAATNSPLSIEHQIVNEKSIASYSLAVPETQKIKLLAKTSIYTIDLLAGMTDLKGNPITPNTISFVTGVSNKIGAIAATPGVVTVVSNNNSGTFDNTIAWPLVANTAYNLYVSKDGGDYTQVITTPAPLLSASFVDQGVSIGSRYKYAVTAMNILSPNVYGAESLFSFSGEIIVSTTATPKNLVAVAGPGDAIAEGVIDISWDAIGNNKYNLYESVNGGAFSILLSNTAVLTHSYIPELGNDNIYQYGLTIQNTNNTESEMIQSVKVVPFGKLASVSAVGADKFVTVTWPTWKNISGVSYSVYVKQGTGAFSSTPIVSGLTSGQFIHGNGSVGSSNPPLVNDILFTYGITTLSTVPTLRASSQSISNTTKTVAPRSAPTAPVNITVNPGDASVTLTWEIAIGLNYDYRISQKSGFDTVYTEVALLKNPTVGRVKLTAINNIEHSFQLMAIDNSVAGAIATTAAVVPRLGGRQVDAGTNTCAIQAGEIWCWGSNQYGQLGNGTKSFAEKQVKVVTPTTGRIGTSWIAVSTGNGHTCGIRNTGEMYCWGLARSGQLGIGAVNTATPPTITPQLVQTPVALVKEAASGNQMVNWTQVSTGNAVTCGIHSNAVTRGQLFCWGYNGNLSLGIAQSAAGVNFEMLPLPVLLGTDSNNNWVEIQAGERHRCGIRQQAIGNTLWCWGLRTSGQAGDNSPNDLTTTYFTEPTQVISTSGATSSDTDWSSVAVGNTHTCAIRGTEKTLWCWGNNLSGQLTIQSGLDTVYAPSQESSAATDWLKVFAYNAQTCGLKNTGAISCWGKNMSGENGSGSLGTSTRAPTVFAGKADWSEIAVGVDNACAMNSTTSVTPNRISCWGSAEKYAIGRFTAESALPVQVGSAKNWFDLTAGSDLSSFFIGLRDISLNNVMYAWGSNSDGNLGNSDNNISKVQTPVAETNSFSWKQISSGRFVSCGIKTDDTLYCWGKDRYIPLVPNDPYVSTTGTTSIPTQIGTDKWLQIDLGRRHACGIKVDNSLWCWGRGRNGELGAGIDLSVATDPEIKPDIANGIHMITVVKPDPNIAWKSVDAGHNVSCAIGEINAVSNLYCWGDNARGQLGIGTNTDVTDATGNVITNNTNKFIPTLVPKPTGVSLWLSVSIGNGTTCAITNNGITNLYCWGDNYSNIIGSRTSRTVLSPVVILNSGASWIDVSVVESHACARKSDNSTDPSSGTLWCWGQNNFGQLGNGNIKVIDPFIGEKTPSQVSISGGTTTYWKNFTTGYDSSCAIRDDNSLWCWGGNFDGQQGTNSSWRTTARSLTFP